MPKGLFVGGTLLIWFLVSPPVAAGPTDTPSPPMNLSAALSEDGTETILSWDPPLSEGSAPVTGYNVYRDGSFLDWVQVRVFEDSTSDNAAVYSVTAENSYGEGLPGLPAIIVGGNSGCVTNPPPKVDPIGCCHFISPWCPL